MSAAPGERPPADRQTAGPSDRPMETDPLAERRALLAARAGFLVEWRDAGDGVQQVAADVLAVLLTRIGLPCDTVAECDASLALLDAESLSKRPPPLLTGTVGEPLLVPEGWLQPEMTYSVALDSSIPPHAWRAPEGLQDDAASGKPSTRLVSDVAAASGAAELAGTTVAESNDGSIGSDGRPEAHLRTLRGKTTRASRADTVPPTPPANAFETTSHFVAIAPIAYPGYHTLQLFDAARTTVALAIAPARCFGVADAVATLQPLDVPIQAPLHDAGHTPSTATSDAAALPAPKPAVWGLTAQVYGLRPPREATSSTTSIAAVTAVAAPAPSTGTSALPERQSARDMGLGDFTMLAALARTAALAGAGALAISPLHAMSNADPGKYSPYSPSSRLFLNAWHIDPAAVLGTAACDAAIAALALGPTVDVLGKAPLIDWPEAVNARLAILRYLFDTHFADATADAGAESSTPLASAAPLRAPPGTSADALAAAAEHRAARAGFDAFRRAGGIALERHARFEALHAARIAAADDYDWREWPSALRDPESADVAAFAETHRRDVDFQLFLQWQAAAGLARAQEAARAAGMPIGLIADLAVGCDSAGSQTWADPEAMLQGLSVGAPPDLFNREGQRWGLTTFSPRALHQQGFAPFIDMVRAALRHAGGLRVDHILGLRRLWLVPDGESASRGAYLRYPLEDLLRLLALESWRHRAIIIGEDLGTVPPGLRETLADAGLLGMRVLWFERDENTASTDTDDTVSADDPVAPATGNAARPAAVSAPPFTAPSKWTRDAVAMTSTHDLPTLAGWWRGDDIGWRAYVETAADAGTNADTVTADDLESVLTQAKERKQDDMRDRARDRTALWKALCDAGLIGDPGGAPIAASVAAENAVPDLPDATDTPDVSDVPDVPDLPPIDAMLRFVAATPAPLALLPLEDILGLAEQPNLPGPSTVHPNWRRRMPYPIDSTNFSPDAEADALSVQKRLADINAVRMQSSSS